MRRALSFASLASAMACFSLLVLLRALVQWLCVASVIFCAAHSFLKMTSSLVVLWHALVQSLCVALSLSVYVQRISSKGRNTTLQPPSQCPTGDARSQAADRACFSSSSGSNPRSTSYADRVEAVNSSLRVYCLYCINASNTASMRVRSVFLPEDDKTSSECSFDT